MNLSDAMLLLGFKTVFLTVCTVLVWGVLSLFRPRIPQFHRMAWGAVLLIGIVGGGLTLTIPVHEEAATVSQKTPAEALAEPIFQTEQPLLFELQTAFDKISSAKPEENVSLENNETNSVIAAFSWRKTLRSHTGVILFCVWGFGIAVLLFWRMILYVQLLRRLKTAVRPTGKFAKQWENLLAEHGICTWRLSLLMTDQISPALLRLPGGMAILVPRILWEEASDTVRDGILRHELAHYRNGDLYVSTLARLLVLVHWFNPMAWLAVRKLEEATEWICDAAAFGDNEQGELHFAESMLAIHQATPMFLYNRPSFGNGNILRRVRFLQNHLERKKEPIMKHIFLTALLVTLLAGALFHLQFVPVQAEEPATLQSENQQTQSPNTSAESSSETPNFIWDGKSHFGKPDFEKFFPDDPEGGLKWDALLSDRELEMKPDEEIFNAFRNGLRRKNVYMSMIRWLGNRYIWNVEKQDRRAIEILYHASASDDFESYHNAIYFGLSVTRDKSPEIIDAMLAVAMKTDDFNNVIGRISWGCSPAEKLVFLEKLEAFRKSDNEKIRDKAESIREFFLDEQAWRQKAVELAKKNALKKYGPLKEEFRENLLNGDSQKRLEILKEIQQGGWHILDETFREAFLAAADDPQWQVRSQITRSFGAYHMSTDPSHAWISEIAEKLFKDEYPEVKYNALYYGLSSFPKKTDGQIHDILESILFHRERNFYHRAVWCLQREPRAKRILDEWINNWENDFDRALRAYEIYQDVTDQAPPFQEKFADQKSDAFEAIYLPIALSNIAADASAEEKNKQISDLIGNEEDREIYVFPERNNAASAIVLCKTVSDRDAILSRYLERFPDYMRSNLKGSETTWLLSSDEFRKQNAPYRVTNTNHSIED